MPSFPINIPSNKNLLALLGIVFLQIGWLSITNAEEPLVDFNRQIRPLLASRCLKCHGPEKHEGDLNLADHDSAVSSNAIVSGQPANSLIVQRIISGDVSERMPPDGEALSAEEIRLIKKWIIAGAPWPSHWAYRPLEKPRVPELDSMELKAWCRTPIDHFIAKRLEENLLLPSSEAERRVLLRRLSFDLCGLPPTANEMQSFLEDNSSDAYEKVVDRLLASSHYGERWARHWMDIVHFAETHGHDQDRPREHAWPYRDYLIQSFNSDKPYSRFVAEQVAGDILYPNDSAAIVATGFLAAGPWDESSLRDIREDSLDRKIAHYIDRDDVVTTVMSTFISSSVHCARCHDHKFDPINQEEYYGLQSVFAGVDKANRLYDADPQIAIERDKLEQEKTRIQNLLSSQSQELNSKKNQEMVTAWEKAISYVPPKWQTLELVETRSDHGTQFKKQADGSVLCQGSRPDKDTYTLVAAIHSNRIAAIRLELLPDELLPMRGPGRQDNGNLHLNEFRAFVVNDDNEGSQNTPIEFRTPEADFNQDGWTVAMAIDGNPSTAWGIYPQVGVAHEAVFPLKEALEISNTTRIQVELQQSHGTGHLIGKFRLSYSEATPSAKLPQEITAILETAVAKRTFSQQIQLAAWLIESKLDERLSKLPQQAYVYCGTNQFATEGSFRPSIPPREVFVLHRGSVQDPQQMALPKALSCLPNYSSELQIDNVDDEGQRRAALAKWLSDDKNVLAWRSIANRIWQNHFGRGIVDTPNDFGQMGAVPSHPELLDWLAVYLQEHNGSLKALHRLIVTSAVYRQSADYRVEATLVDADNRLLWRANRRRLDAESYHDALLVNSNTLDRKQGGPSVKQFIQTPGVHVTPNVDYQNFSASDAVNNRRSIYRFLFRTIPDPFLNALDCPDGSQLSPKRSSSLTALQAFATLNDKFVLFQCQQIANRIQGTHNDPSSQVTEAYRLLFYRPPTDEEHKIVTQYVEKHGLPNACRFLINTNEYLFVD